ncbi:MAG: DUF2490 domain-containing protein [Flavobacteriales bacterium]|nr:DUF2490 domain-containing protein [Flavobacteriales bacterium]
MRPVLRAPLWKALCLLLIGAHGPFARAQRTNTQLWVDGIVGKSVASYYMAECEFSYQTLLSDQGRWESLNASPSLEVSPTAHWSFLVGLPLSYTKQREGDATFEWRGQVGAKYTFTPFKRVQTRLNLRYEDRNVRDQESGQLLQSQRARVRAEVVVPLDTRNYSADTMWYALADAEAFVTMDQDVQERFANRARVRIGLGRKFSYNWRAEVVYTFQRSRNAIADTDPTTDHIFRVRLKYYFTPRSRVQAQGDNAN